MAAENWAEVTDAEGTPFYHKFARPLKSEERDRIANAHIVLRTGPFTPTEDRRIRKNWRRFISDRNLKEEECRTILGMDVAGGREEPGMRTFKRESAFFPRLCKKVWYRIARQVYDRARRLLRNFDYSGVFTAEEDKQLQNHVSVHGTNWTLIGGLMGRSNACVQGRFRKLEKIVNTGPWTPAESRKLALALLEVCHLESVREVCMKAEIDKMDWVLVSNLLGKTRNSMQCKKRWEAERKRIMAGKFRLSREEKIDFVDLLWTKKFKDEKSIDWTKIAAELAPVFPLYADAFYLRRIWSSLSSKQNIYKDVDPKTLSLKEKLQIVKQYVRTKIKRRRQRKMPREEEEE